jgi:hypothetical protein
MVVPQDPRVAGDGDKLPNGDARQETSTEQVEIRERVHEDYELTLETMILKADWVELF